MQLPGLLASEVAPVSAEVAQMRQASKVALVSAELTPQVRERLPTASRVALVSTEVAVMLVSTEVAPKLSQASELPLRQLQQQWR